MQHLHAVAEQDLGLEVGPRRRPSARSAGPGPAADWPGAGPPLVAGGEAPALHQPGLGCDVVQEEVELRGSSLLPRS